MMEIIQSLNYVRGIENLKVFIFAMLFLLATQFYHLMEAQITTGISNAVVVFNDRLTVSKSKFDFKGKIDRLRSYGVLERFPKMEKPHYYILMHLALGVIFGFGLSIVTPALFPLGIILGWLGLDYYFKRNNDNENNAMMEDIFAVTNILSTQLKGGVYVGNALAECKDIVSNKRLKKALYEFDRHIKLNDVTLLEAVNELEAKFDSVEVSSLCMVIRQNEETGRMRDVIGDLARQINATEETIFQAKKAKTERSLTYAILIIFTDIMFFVMWEFIQNILQQF